MLIALRLNRYVALKIAKSKPEFPSKELEIWKHVSAESRPHPGKKTVMVLLDSFKHHGPTGTHECFVLKVMGPCARTYIKGFQTGTSEPNSHLIGSQNGSKIKLLVVKSMLRQVLLGLDFLHQRGILHNDLHPGNILVSIKSLRSIEESQVGEHDEEIARAMIETQGFVREKLGRVCKRERPHDASGLFSPNTKRQKSSHAVGIEDAMWEDGSTIVAASSSKLMAPAPASRNDAQPKRIASPPPFNGAVKPLSPVRIKISDMGGAFFLSHPPDRLATPTNIRSPEMILGCSIDESQDIWAFGCLVFELITGRALFMVVSNDYDTSDESGPVQEEHHAGNEGTLSSDDSEEQQQVENGRKAITEECENNESNPAVSRAPGLNTSYLQQFACRLGPLSPFILSEWPKASLFFEKDGKAKPTTLDSPPWPSLETHFDKRPTLVDVNPSERVALLELIRYIMQYDPKKRPSATQLLRHPWFLHLDGEDGGDRR